MTTHFGQQPMRWWHTTDEIIEKWLKDRQALLVLYYQLFDMPINCNTMTQFCEALIDYVSFGHFRVFEKLAQIEAPIAIERETLQNASLLMNDDQSIQNQQEHGKKPGLNKNYLANIFRTTLQALDFNDKYAEQTQKNWVDLKTDLSDLGEQLANRMDWEDELIKHYLSTTEELRENETPAPVN